LARGGARRGEEGREIATASRVSRAPPMSPQSKAASGATKMLRWKANRLSARRNASRAAMTNRAARNCLTGVRVLVVEDQTLIAMLIEDVLAGCGCEVVGPMGRVARAEHAARAQDFDCHPIRFRHRLWRGGRGRAVRRAAGSQKAVQARGAARGLAPPRRRGLNCPVRAPAAPPASLALKRDGNLRPNPKMPLLSKEKEEGGQSAPNQRSGLQKRMFSLCSP
jgi:hypothetical protein